MKILRNAVVCKACKGRIESKHEYSVISCLCGRVSIGGGKTKLERYSDAETYKEISMLEIECGKRR